MAQLTSKVSIWKSWQQEAAKIVAVHSLHAERNVPFQGSVLSGLLRVSMVRSKQIRLRPFLTAIFIGVLMTFQLGPIETSSAQKPADATSHNDRGLELIKAGKAEEAIVSFKQAIKLKPDFAEAHKNLGDLYFLVEEYKKAVEAYKQAIRYQSDFVTAYANIGTAYFRMGEHKKAIESYKQAIRLDPTQPPIYYNLASTYVEQDNREAALEQYKILKTKDPALASKLYLLIYKPMVAVSVSANVRLSTIVTDPQGQPATDLNKGDFQVIENGVPQTISSVTPAKGQLIYALTIDTSGSVLPFLDLVLATGKFVIENNSPNDETLLVRFISSDKIETVLEFTSDKMALNKAVEELYVEGGPSAIRDAVYLSVKRVGQYRFPERDLRRAIILISDGDERSSYYREEDLLRLLRKVDVQIFVISLSNVNSKRTKLNQDQPQAAIDLLNRLAHETGGQAFFPKSLTDLQDAVRRIMSLLRSQYVVEYTTSNGVAAGTYKRVGVSIVPKPGREKWEVVTRSGYIASEPFQPEPK
jgi:Ca-activated chloride channel homolog